jgi:putative ABC transport system permease protein
MSSEIRYVTRSLFRRKSFTLVTVLTLALGIGAATAIFAMVDWFLFRSPASSTDLFMIGTMSDDGRFVPSLYQYQLKAYSVDNSVFSEFALSAYRVGNVVVEKKPVGVGMRAVSTNFFRMIGASPALGRGFVPGEDVEGRDQEVVVSFNFWKNHLHASADALGSRILVNQDECMVIGILREGLRMPPYCASEVFRPLVLKDNPDQPWDPNLVVIGHARPGVSKEQAQAALAAIRVDVPAKMSWYKDRSKPALSTLKELEKIYRPEVRWMMLGAVSFLYAIACLNATNLMLVQMMGRQREISIRLALGGGRWGLIRLLLIESFGITVCGSLLGALIANWLIPVFRMAARYQNQPSDPSMWHLYWRTYVILGGLTLVTATVIALVPALNLLRADIQGGLKTGGGSVGESRGMARLRSMFVVLQATFAVVLLVGAGLMVRTFQKLEEVDLGFDPARRINLQVNFPDSYPSEPKERLAILRRLQDELQRVPGVVSAAFGSDNLLAGYEYTTIDLEARDRSTMKVNAAYVSSEYLRVGGVALKAGKWLGPDAQGEIMINESMAKTRFGETNPVGQYIRPMGTTGNYKGWLVVGVVADVRENLRAPPGPRIYMPILWSPGTASSFVIDMSGEPSGEAVARLQSAVFLFDPRIVSDSAIPLANRRLDQLRDEHLALSVLKVLSGIAILLTIVGMFSMLAYTVDRRMSEFGIRMALGATPSDLIVLVMQRGMALTVLGVGMGIAAALGLTRFLQSLLFETQSFDPLVLAGVAALLLLSALGACTLPAFKASKPDVSLLLKSD